MDIVSLLYLASLGIPFILLGMYRHFHVSYRMSLLGGVVLLFSLPVILLVSSNDTANIVSVLAYYLLLAGLILAIVEYRKSRVVEVSPSTSSYNQIDHLSADLRKLFCPVSDSGGSTWK